MSWPQAFEGGVGVFRFGLGHGNPVSSLQVKNPDYVLGDGSATVILRNAPGKFNMLCSHLVKGQVAGPTQNQQAWPLAQFQSKLPKL